MLKVFFKIIIIFFFFTHPARSEDYNNILINGNERISDETILVFSELPNDRSLDEKAINVILKKIYQSGYFKDVIIKIQNNNLIIDVVENPIIQTIFIEGIKRKKTEAQLYKILSLKNRSSFNSNIIKKDEVAISNFLKDRGYYFLEIITYAKSSLQKILKIIIIYCFY